MTQIAPTSLCHRHKDTRQAKDFGQWQITSQSLTERTDWTKTSFGNRGIVTHNFKLRLGLSRVSRISSQFDQCGRRQSQKNMFYVLQEVVLQTSKRMIAVLPSVESSTSLAFADRSFPDRRHMASRVGDGWGQAGIVRKVKPTYSISILPAPRSNQNWPCCNETYMFGYFESV